jgi:hypothetical protein
MERAFPRPRDEAVVSRGHRDAETPFRQGSIGEVCRFTHPRAQLNAARPRPLALLTLLTTAPQARHAPRLAPYVLTRMRGRGTTSVAAISSVESMTAIRSTDSDISQPVASQLSRRRFIPYLLPCFAEDFSTPFILRFLRLFAAILSVSSSAVCFLFASIRVHSRFTFHGCNSGVSALSRPSF